jgi:hypothetical protein
MRSARCTFLVMVLACSGLAPGRAEDPFGVRVYAAATYDADTSAAVAKMAGKASCYRTPDSLAKVIAFYSKLPGVTVVHTGDKGAMFKAKGANITVQSPWMDMKNGTRHTDTLISIVKA